MITHIYVKWGKLFAEKCTKVLAIYTQVAFNELKTWNEVNRTENQSKVTYIVTSREKSETHLVV